MENNMDYNVNEPSMGYVRVIHTVPDAPNVDIYANDTLVAENLAFGEYSEYASLPEGTYKITLYVTGNKEDPVLANMLMVHPESRFTIAATGLLNDIEFIGIADANENEETDKAMVRFLHLSPDAPAVDITLPDGTPIFNDVAYKEITPYLYVPAANYTLEARVAGTHNIALTVPDLALEPGKIYTIYAIGLVDGTPALQALALTDGM